MDNSAESSYGDFQVDDVKGVLRGRGGAVGAAPPQQKTHTQSTPTA